MSFTTFAISFPFSLRGRSGHEDGTNDEAISAMVLAIKDHVVDD
jgi:hypothetical protein